MQIKSRHERFNIRLTINIIKGLENPTALMLTDLKFLHVYFQFPPSLEDKY
jgi:hypothetical protein